MAKDTGFNWGFAGKLGGGLLAGAGSILGGLSAASQYATTAEASRLAATEALARADYEQWVHMDQAEDLVGGIVNQLGAAGIEMTGSPMDYLSEVITKLEIDRLMIQREGEIQHRQQMANYRGYKKAEKDAKRGGFLGAIGSFASAFL